MYPLIIIGNIRIYTFGLFLIIAWIIFFFLLHQLSQKKGIKNHIFSDVISFTLVIFLFSRLFYMFGDWRNEQYAFRGLLGGDGWGQFMSQFFLRDDYGFSLLGGIIGFFLVFFWKIRKKPRSAVGYLDIIVPSFLAAAIVGYIGATFGGQLYGIPFDSPISLSYNTKYSAISAERGRFPLPLLYALLVGILFFFSQKLSKKQLPEGFIGLILMGFYGGGLFLFDFLNGREDMFVSKVGLGGSQIVGIIFITISIL